MMAFLGAYSTVEFFIGPNDNYTIKMEKEETEKKAEEERVQKVQVRRLCLKFSKWFSSK